MLVEHCIRDKPAREILRMLRARGGPADVAEQSYSGGLEAAMRTLVDDFALRYPGIHSVDHVYFYAVHGADKPTREAYLERAYRLGREF